MFVCLSTNGSTTLSFVVLQVMDEIFKESQLDGGDLHNPTAIGLMEAPRPGQRVYRVVITLRFPHVRTACFCWKPAFAKIMQLRS